jgi:hypothetical protein
MSAADPRRIARSESLFRDVNERIAETARHLGADHAEFVCECADTSCSEHIQARLEEYEEVRSDPTRFLVAPGHEEPDYESVEEREPNHRVVAKDKDSRVEQAVRRLYPRSN